MNQETATLLVQGASMLDQAIEITNWKSYSITSNFLTPSDQWHAEIGDELLNREILKVLVPGRRVQWRFAGAPQMAGYLTSVDTTCDRSTGTSIRLEGFDSMWPVTDSQIDPNKHYPDKLSLEDILFDILPQFGFANIAIDNEANVELAANRALHSQKRGVRKVRHRRRTTTLKRFKLPKKKPQHNDTFWQFLMRLLNRSGFWMWPTVDGLGVVVSTPEYDQDPSFELRRTFDGKQNNIIAGGIRRDCADQPSEIIARGNVPPTVHEHTQTRVVVDNPYVVGLGWGVTLQELSGRSPSQITEDQARGQPTPQQVFGKTIAQIQEDEARGQVPPSYVSYVKHLKTITEKNTKLIPVKPITKVNAFAPDSARPCFLKDEESHTLDELENFAKRQMSFHTRKAFVVKYTVEGHAIGDVIPQPDMMCTVTDELSGFQGQLWVLGRTFNCSRKGGVTCDLELLAPNSVFL